MKYLIMAMAAGTFIACNEGPNDRMEERSDRDRQERVNETPEMSGEYDEMRGPVDRVNPPNDLVPYNHEIRNDSVIEPTGHQTDAPDGSKAYDAEVGPNSGTNARTGGTTPQTNTGSSTTTAPMDAHEGSGTAPAATGNAYEQEDALPADTDIENDSLIEPGSGTQTNNTGTQPVMPEGDSPHHSPGSIDTIQSTAPANPE